MTWAQVLSWEVIQFKDGWTKSKSGDESPKALVMVTQRQALPQKSRAQKASLDGYDDGRLL